MYVWHQAADEPQLLGRTLTSTHTHLIRSEWLYSFTVHQHFTACSSSCFTADCTFNRLTFFRLQRRWTLAHNHTLSSGRCAANPFLSRPSSVCRLLAVGILVYMLAARRVDGGRNEARSSHVSPNCVTCFPLRRRWMSYLSCCSGSRIYFPSLRSRRRRRTTWAGRRTWIARPWKPGRPVVMLTEPLSSSWTRHTGWGGAEAAAEGRGWRECHTVGRRHPATLIYSETLRFETQNQASTFQTAVLCSAQLQWHGQDIRERGFQNKNVDWNNTSGFHLKKKGNSFDHCMYFLFI